MTLMHTRRAFLVSVPAVSGGIIALGREPEATSSCQSCADDPVAAEAMRQLALAIRGLAEAPRGEHARQAAAALRVLAANGKAKNLDARLRSALQTEVRTYGRQNVLHRELDPGQFRAAAREFGVAPPELLGVDARRRGKALDLLLAAGVTPVIADAANFFDRSGAHLDAQYANIRPAQTTKEEQQYCAGLRDYVSNLEGIMLVTCVLAPGAACAFAVGAYIGARIYYDNYSGCPR